MNTWHCCYDPNSEMSCFVPLGSDIGKHNPNKAASSGISPAGAAILTAFFFLAIPLGYLGYSRFAGPNYSTGISNVNAA